MVAPNSRVADTAATEAGASGQPLSAGAPRRGLAAALCAVAASGWLGPDAGLPGYLTEGLILGLILIIPIAFTATIANHLLRHQRVVRLSPLMRLVAAVPSLVVMALVALSLIWLFTAWIGRVEGYVIPRLPVEFGRLVPVWLTEGLGALLCLGALVFSVASLKNGERAKALAVVSAVMALFVIWSAFIFHNVTDSPYQVVRSFAMYASRGDQEAMNEFLSEESLAHFRELPEVTYYVDGESHHLVTVDFMFGVAAPNCVWLGLDTEGQRAKMHLGIPWRWSLWSFAGKGGHIYLIRERDGWKIDAWRDWQELEERLELDTAE